MAELWTMSTVPGHVRLAVGRSGQGPNPLVALHGITTQHRSFTAIARHLVYPDGLLAVDLRGRGDSDAPAWGYGMEEHARDVLRVLDYAGLNRAVLLGHSMGGFVAIHTALLFPDRVRAIVLLDSGWPRAESGVPPDSAVQSGLARAFSRLSMTFASPDAYLEFWFPGAGLTIDRLPPDLADYYLYDLREVGGAWRPKTSPAAAREDAQWLATRGVTAAQLAGVTCPVALVRPTQGFFPDTPPLIGAGAHAAIMNTLDVRADLVLEGANHYTMMNDPFAARIAATSDDFVETQLAAA